MGGKMTNKKRKQASKELKALCWDSKWTYIPAVKTNILQRFREMNWTPPSEVSR